MSERGHQAWGRRMPLVGAVAERTRKVEPTDIERFTEISGDRNPLHYDEAVARAGPLRRDAMLRETIISAQGQPPLWLLTDGPIKPGGDIHRVELWLYPTTSTQFNFIDGRLVSQAETSLRPWARIPGNSIGPVRLRIAAFINTTAPSMPRDRASIAIGMCPRMQTPICKSAT